MSWSESPADRAFRTAGPIGHLYTKPLETDVFFHGDEERAIAVNYIAIAAMESGIILLAYAIMNNHFHFILAGTQIQISAFYERFKYLLNIHFRYHGRGKLMDGAEPGFTPIESLKQLRNEIAYVIRNAFAVRQDVNVFADPWSTGYLYFNPLLVEDGLPASQLKGRSLREFTCSRSIDKVDARIHVKDGMAQPWSFVDYKLVMSFYDNARQFVNSVVKNVEAMVELANGYGETLQFNDDELYPLINKMCREKLRVANLSELDLQGKKELAVLLKNQYSASNGQIARLVKLELKDVNTLFPLVTKNQIR